MAYSSRLIRAAFGSVAILGSAVLGVTVMTNTFAANFSAGGGQCKITNSSFTNSSNLVKGLAIEEGSSKCICPSQAAYERLLRTNPDVLCNISNNQNKVQNFNQPPGTTSTTNGGTTTTTNGGTTTTTNGGTTTTTSGVAFGNPGNHKQVGRATEGPPKGTRNSHFGCCGGPTGTGTTTDSTGATGPTGGDKGASN